MNDRPRCYTAAEAATALRMSGRSLRDFLSHLGFSRGTGSGAYHTVRARAQAVDGLMAQEQVREQLAGSLLHRLLVVCGLGRRSVGRLWGKRLYGPSGCLAGRSGLWGRCGRSGRTFQNDTAPLVSAIRPRRSRAIIYRLLGG
jgi:hypothetical protein